MGKGFTFLRKDESRKMHLKIVISDPDPEDMVLVVSVSTIRKGVPHDTSCELHVAEHPFIKDPSYISYYYAMELSSVKILQEKFKGLIVLKEDVSVDLLKRIQEGARYSKFLPKYLRKFFDFF